MIIQFYFIFCDIILYEDRLRHIQRAGNRDRGSLPSIYAWKIPEEKGSLVNDQGLPQSRQPLAKRLLEQTGASLPECMDRFDFPSADEIPPGPEISVD